MSYVCLQSTISAARGSRGAVEAASGSMASSRWNPVVYTPKSNTAEGSGDAAVDRALGGSQHAGTASDTFGVWKVHHVMHHGETLKWVADSAGGTTCFRSTPFRLQHVVSGQYLSVGSPETTEAPTSETGSLWRPSLWRGGLHECTLTGRLPHSLHFCTSNVFECPSRPRHV